MIRKLVVADGRVEREVLLVGKIVVGRDPTCQISELDALLSRRHAEFVADAHGAIIRDLSSRNGVFVNGVKVPEHKLVTGDVVQLGHLHVTYIEDATPQAAEAHAKTHATTAIGMETPTMAVKPRQPAPTPDPLPQAEPDADTTIISAPRRVADTPPASPAAATRDLEDEIEVTRAPAASSHAAVSMRDTALMDPDRTMVPGLDVTRAAVPRTVPQAKAAPATEARVVANGRLIVTEASPSCAHVIGARAETIVGGGLAEVLTRSLLFVSTGDGPSALSLSIVRSESGGAITVTFKTGPGSGISS